MSTTYSQPRACRNGLFHIHPTTRTCWVALDAGIQSQFLKALPKILPKSLKWTFDLISIDNLFKHLSKKKKNLNQDLLKINSLVFEHEWLWVNFPLTRNFLPTHSPRASTVSRRANGQHVVTHWKGIKTFMSCLRLQVTVAQRGAPWSNPCLTNTAASVPHILGCLQNSPTAEPKKQPKITCRLCASIHCKQSGSKRNLFCFQPALKRPFT